MRVHRVVIGLIAGLIVGSAIGAWDSAIALRVAAVVEPIGQLWVNAIRMTIVPLVVSLLFVGVAGRADDGALGRLGGVTIATFFLLLIFAGFIALLIAPSLINDMKLSADAALALRAHAQAGAAQVAGNVTKLPGFGAWVTGIVPANVVKAAADGAMLPLIVFTLLFALAARKIDPGLRAALIDFFSGIAGATTTLVDWVIWAAPVGIFALVVAASTRAGIALAGATAYYIVAISAAFVLYAMLVYPFATVLGKIPLGWFTRAVLPAQAVALSSSSSLASLPALVEGSRALGLPVEVGGFTLPLSVSMFKAATPISWLVGTLFLAKLYGISLSTTAIVTIVLTSIVLSFTIPGVPQGSQLLLAPVLASYGIPPEGIALLIAADTIPDLFATMSNVTADLVAAAVVARIGVSGSGSVAEPGGAGASSELDDGAADEFRGNDVDDIEP
jgi:Na+/H+-dicarboxylate symporter